MFINSVLTIVRTSCNGNISISHVLLKLAFKVLKQAELLHNKNTQHHSL